jgi:hypothetical protein
MARARAAGGGGAREAAREAGRAGALGSARRPGPAPGAARSPQEEARGLPAADVTLRDPPAVAPPSELGAVARALPPAVAVLAPGGQLALSFGPSLEVDLRSTAAGVEVLLRPEPGLARAAEAELPRVVAALRARGIAVARAEVRRGSGGAGRAR